MCWAINVTVTPSPFTVVSEGGNVTLSCQVSPRRRAASLPVVRWMFQPESGREELLVARVNMQRAKFYGNYTKSFHKPKMKLTVVKHGKIYNLLIVNISEQDRGLYSCRVQEFKKQRERWKALTNGSASTQLRGLSNAQHGLVMGEKKKTLQLLCKMLHCFELLKTPLAGGSVWCKCNRAQIMH